MIITLSVTQEDLDKGLVCNLVKCPVARAINRNKSKFNFNFDYATVDSIAINFWNNTPKVNTQFIKTILLPEEITLFIDRYDMNMNKFNPIPKPFDFQLEI